MPVTAEMEETYQQRQQDLSAAVTVPTTAVTAVNAA